MTASTPKIAGTSSVKIALEKGKTYSFCTCGLSEKQPFCDGKHKGTEFSPRKFSAIKDVTASLCLCKQSAKVPFCDGSHSRIGES